MTDLHRLPEIADRRLGGLRADARMLGQIRIAAAENPPKRSPRWKPVLVSTVAAALCLTIAVLFTPIAGIVAPNGVQPSNEVLDTRAAGGAPKQGESLWVRAMGTGASNVTVSGADAVTADYRNLFAPEHNGNFPLLLVNGAAYRMLISPTNMSDSLLGESLGEVTEYTLEPALSTGSGVVSNIVSAGETVYAVQGMQGAMAAAYVKGGLRAFQRVSYAGTAILGDETLTDTLAGAERITAMELTGAGIVDDVTTAQSLMQTLLTNAEYDRAALGSGDTRSLLIALDNGLLMQLMVGDDTVSACGTWSCPEFFEAYAEATAQ